MIVSAFMLLTTINEFRINFPYKKKKIELVFKNF